MEFHNRMQHQQQKHRRPNNGEHQCSCHVAAIRVKHIAHFHPLHVRVTLLCYHSHCTCCTIRREQHCHQHKVQTCYHQICQIAFPSSTASRHHCYHQWCSCIRACYCVWHHEKPVPDIFQLLMNTFSHHSGNKMKRKGSYYYYWLLKLTPWQTYIPT